MMVFFNRFDFKKHGAFFCGLFLCLYFTFHLLQGPRSILYLQNLNAQNEQLETIYADAFEQRESLEKKVVMLRPETIDPDLLEERARIMLGYMSEDEIMVIK